MASDCAFALVFPSASPSPDTFDAFFDNGVTFSRIVREMEECFALLNGEIKSRRGVVYGFRLMLRGREAGGLTARQLFLDRLAGDVVMGVEIMP